MLKRERKKKCIVFSSYTSVAQKIVERLTQVFDNEYVKAYLENMSSNDLRISVKEFSSTDEGCVMVLDASGEEGLNLQMAEIIIHYDLPWSPNRIEQRIGRVDRIGNDERIRSYVFIGPDMESSLYDAWYRVLKEGIGVFDRSIASLQFYIDKKMPKLTLEFLDRGAGLAQLIEDISSEIKQEKEKIYEQQALDEIDALTENAQEYFQPLVDYERDPKSIYKSIDPWLSEALNFKKASRQKHICDYENTPQTLVPKTWLHRISREPINKGPMTDRRPFPPDTPCIGSVTILLIHSMSISIGMTGGRFLQYGGISLFRVKLRQGTGWVTGLIISLKLIFPQLIRKQKI